MKVISLITLVLGLFLAPYPSQAQSVAKTPRIGILTLAFVPNPALEAFRQGLRDRGYMEGQSIALEYRFAEGKFERLPELAAELVRLKVDIILAEGGQATAAARHATETIPIVFPAIADPVGQGLVASLARPGIFPERDCAEAGGLIRPFEFPICSKEEDFQPCHFICLNSRRRQASGRN